MELRNYVDADYDEVVSLWKETGLFIESLDTREILRKKIKFSPDSFVVVVNNGKIIGSVVMLLDPWMSTIFRVSVSPESQKEGIGGLLMDEAERRARRIGANSVGVYIEREKVGRFYEKRGYCSFGSYESLEKKF